MAAQQKRLIYIYNRLLEGNSYTVNELMDLAASGLDDYGVSKRTLQRDMRLLGEIDPNIIYSKDGAEFTWKYQRIGRSISPNVSLSSNEVLSLHILKAHLKNIKGTSLQEEIDMLYRRLDLIAPADVVNTDSLFLDKNIGQYDYSGKENLIKKVIKYITAGQWLDIQYKSLRKGTEKIIQVLLRTIFTYQGNLYVIGYIPKHKEHAPFVLQNITKMEPTDFKLAKVPDFNYEEWAKNRFGVFHSEPVNVKLRIEKDFSHYFENRFWHSTQNFDTAADGSLLLYMKVPLSPEFISWIMSWGEAIKVVKPDELIEQVIAKHTAALSNYKEKGA